MRGIWRLLAVAAVAMGSFVLALVNFREVPAKECQMEAVENPAYQVAFLTPFTVESTTQTFRVTRDGAPVTGARVCMRADMGGLGGMSGMGISDLARETEPGQYDVPIRYEMSGFWQGAVIVTTGAGKPVRIPLTIQVR